eukprot:361207-Chlamydomonas_euryale.AAC.10
MSNGPEKLHGRHHHVHNDKSGVRDGAGRTVQPRRMCGHAARPRARRKVGVLDARTARVDDARLWGAGAKLGGALNHEVDLLPDRTPEQAEVRRSAKY